MPAELDPEARALLADMAEAGSLPAQALSVAATRADFEASFATSEDTEPVGEVRDLEVPGPAGGVPVRVYAPDAERPHPVLVFAHGGGWVRGSVETHDDLCRSLTNEAGCAVVSVDYRRPPEHPFPAALEDVYATLQWVADFGSNVHLDGERVAVGGDSAGGNLAAATALLARDRDGPDLAHQVLLYPVLDSAMDTDSYEAFASGYIPSRESMAYYWEQYLDSPVDGANPYASPLRVRDPGGLAPATVLTAECDPLRDEGQAYAARLEEGGVPVLSSTVEGLTHGFLSFPERFEEAAAVRATVAEQLGDAFGT
jgi:acetyl esterase